MLYPCIQTHVAVLAKVSIHTCCGRHLAHHPHLLHEAARIAHQQEGYDMLPPARQAISQAPCYKHLAQQTWLSLLYLHGTCTPLLHTAVGTHQVLATPCYPELPGQSSITNSHSKRAHLGWQDHVRTPFQVAPKYDLLGGSLAPTACPCHPRGGQPYMTSSCYTLLAL